MIRILSLALIASAAIAAGAQSAPPPDHEAMRNKVQAACGDDFAKFCPDADGPREHHECLKAHESELSESCAALQAEMKSHHMGGRHHRGPAPASADSPAPTNE